MLPHTFSQDVYGTNVIFQSNNGGFPMSNQQISRLRTNPNNLQTGIDSTILQTRSNANNINNSQYLNNMNNYSQYIGNNYNTHGISNANNINQSNVNISQSNGLIMSPTLNDDNRLFGLYSPSNIPDIYSPMAFASNNSMTHVFQRTSSTLNKRDQQEGFFKSNLHKDVLSEQEQAQQFNIHKAFQERDQQKADSLIAIEQGEKKLANYSSIVMKQTFFNHLSLQIFFALVLVLFIYKINYILILAFLWFVDLFSFILGFKRGKLEIDVDESKKEEMSNVWRFLETVLSILFKVCFYIYIDVEKYKFYYVPCTLLIYVLLRFFFVISKKLTENGPISTLLNESFTWGFKIFFVGQIFLISVKMSEKIEWAWQDVFWPYWIFFYIMIGTNSVFVILLLSKVLLKCLGQPVQSFEIKGLFWFFMLSNGLCVNSTLFVKGLVSRLDHFKDGDAQIAFKYSCVFIFMFVFYTLIFWKGIWQYKMKYQLNNNNCFELAIANRIFMFHFSQESEDTEGDITLRNDSQIKSSSLRGQKMNEQNEIIDDSHSHSQQQNGIKKNNQNNESSDGDEDDEDDGDEGEGEIYGPEEQMERNNANQILQFINSQNLPQPQIPNNNNTKKKIFKKENMTAKTTDRKGIPLFLEKLSSTYFTILTNNGMKPKKDDGGTEQLPKSKDSSQIKNKKQNKSTNEGQEHEKADKKRISSSNDIPKKKKKKVVKQDMNKSDMCDASSNKQRKVKSKKEDDKNKIDATKGRSDSLGQVEISFNDNKKKIQTLPKNELLSLAYETQQKFSELISSPKGQELKKREEERKSKNQLPHSSDTVEYTKNEQKSIESMRPEQNLSKGGEESNINCVICFENEPDTVYLPCGHGGICYECAMDVMKKTGECYLCRNEIESVVQIDIKSKDPKKKIIAVTAALEDRSETNDQDKTVNASQVANHATSDRTDRTNENQNSQQDRSVTIHNSTNNNENQNNPNHNNNNNNNELQINNYNGNMNNQVTELRNQIMGMEAIGNIQQRNALILSLQNLNRNHSIQKENVQNMIMQERRAAPNYFMNLSQEGES